MNTDETLTIRLFAQAREAAGHEWLETAAQGLNTVGDLRRRLAIEFPVIEPLLPRCAIAVNRVYVLDDKQLSQGDEIAVIPPVAGG